MHHVFSQQFYSRILSTVVKCKYNSTKYFSTNMVESATTEGTTRFRNRFKNKPFREYLLHSMNFLIVNIKDPIRINSKWDWFWML